MHPNFHGKYVQNLEAVRFLFEDMRNVQHDIDVGCLFLCMTSSCTWDGTFELDHGRQDALGGDGSKSNPVVLQQQWVRVA